MKRWWTQLWRRILPPVDTNRDEAQRVLQLVRARRPEVQRLVGVLQQQGEQNHFIERLNMHVRRQG